MNIVSIIAGLVIGIFVGGLIVWVLINRQLQNKDREIKNKEAEIRDLSAGMASARTSLELKDKELAEMQKQLIVQFETWLTGYWK